MNSSALFRGVFGQQRHGPQKKQRSSWDDNLTECAAQTYLEAQKTARKLR